jgi:hypothetical protein
MRFVSRESDTASIHEPCFQRVLSRGRRGAAGRPRLEVPAPTNPGVRLLARIWPRTLSCAAATQSAVLDALLDAVRRGESRALVVERP